MRQALGRMYDAGRRYKNGQTGNICTWEGKGGGNTMYMASLDIKTPFDVASPQVIAKVLRCRQMQHLRGAHISKLVEQN